MKALVLVCCVVGFACTRHHDARPEHMLVCGTLSADDGKPVQDALMQLHRIEKDVPGNPKANSFEVAVTAGDGSFHLGSPAPDRQYWLAIAGVRSCSAVYHTPEFESDRIPVTFHRSESTGDCKATIRIVFSSCTPKLQ